MGGRHKGKGEEKVAEVRKEGRRIERRPSAEKNSMRRRKVDQGPPQANQDRGYELPPLTLSLSPPTEEAE